MRTTVVRKSVNDESADCRQCDWSADFFDNGARRCTDQARRHVKKTGHRVDVFREQHVAVVPVTEK